MYRSEGGHDGKTLPRFAGGAEAGVWVIADKTDLPTKFIKTVVTKDEGRYLVPEDPLANERGRWGRGQGLTAIDRAEQNKQKI